jgi:hypothetical protein
MIQVLP